MALKKIGADAKEGVHITALREIKILESLKHDNVVSLIEVVRSRGKSTTQLIGGNSRLTIVPFFWSFEAFFFQCSA